MSHLRPWQLSRRACLRGVGAAVALPFLDAMRPARAQTVAGPRRLCFFYTPCGINMAAFTPSTTGRDFALSPMLQPLADVRSRVAVVSGARNTAAMDLGDGPGDHARGTGSFLTSVHPLKSEGRLQNGTSVDQLVAQQMRGQTRLSSLELGAEGGALVGSCDSYSCAYSNNISWASSSVPMPKEVNPRAVFDRLFQGAEADLSPQQRADRRRRRLSVLDFVTQDSARLNDKLGTDDRQKLDAYLTSVRELEQSIFSPPQVSCEFPARPEGADADFESYLHQMLDLVALAFACDLTRVATFMIGTAASNRSYRFLGHPGGHHEYSHHQNDPGKLQALADIGRFEVAQVAYLAGKLDAISEVDGSALDNSALFLSSELTDGNAHNHDNVPCLLVGGGGGVLNTNQHVRVSSDTEVGDVFLTLLRTVGITRSSFGQYGTHVVDALLT